MDLYSFISLVSLVHTGIFCTVRSAPTAAPPSEPGSVHHVRTKRCSCTTFVDTECLYFCHLNIIWVNTPERVVSYGLGNTQRTKRAIQDSPKTRCRCLHSDDRACTSFCHQDDLRSVASPDTEIQSPHRKCFDPTCKHKVGAGTRTMTSVKSSSKSWLSPQMLRDAVKSRLLPQKRRQHHRARAWEGESGAS